MQNNEKNTGDKQRTNEGPHQNGTPTTATVTVPSININKPGYRAINIAKAREAKRKLSEIVGEETQSSQAKRARLLDVPELETEEEPELEDRNNDIIAGPSIVGSESRIMDKLGSAFDITARIIGACVVTGVVSYVRASIYARQNTSDDVGKLRERWTT